MIQRAKERVLTLVRVSAPSRVSSNKKEATMRTDEATALREIPYLLNETNNTWCCDDNSCGEVVMLRSREEIQEATKGKNQYICVRHGFSGRNDRGVFGGVYPEPVPYELTPKGIEVVEQTAQEIRQAGGVDMIFSSPFVRAMQTAEIVSAANGNLPIIQDIRLREASNGEHWEGQKTALLYTQHPDRLRYFYQDLGMDGGTPSDTLAGVQHRMFDYVKELEEEYEGKRIALVSHGDPLLLLEKAFKGWTNQECMHLRTTVGMMPTGGFRELNFSYFPFDENADLVFNTPYTDEIVFTCQTCPNGTMRHTPIAS